MRQQWEWVDVLKGIGILSVAYSHLYGGYFRDLLFTFHMPLFFLIGGFLFRPRPGTGAYLRKKALHLLVPYAAFLGVLSLPMVYHAVSDTGASWHETAALAGNLILGGRALTAWLAVFWFVTCFFAAQQLTNWLVSRLAPHRVYWVMVLLAVSGYVQQLYFRGDWLVGNLDVVAMAAPLYFVGYEVKRLQVDWERGWALAAVILFACAGCAALAVTDLVKVDMKYALYGIPVFSFCSAIALTAVTASLAKRIAEISSLRRLLGHLGRASMTIMYLHIPVIYFFRQHEEMGKSPLILAAAILIPLAVHHLIALTPPTRALFAGSAVDWRACFGAAGRHASSSLR
ncbi:acyltransferase family protein [Salinicola corii]|uniref:Acyltransferase family protein n=1 Tax=Salinicola corii TaxID=2606937 RepID=A0A640WII0_9GAMM|nr:acyltransferase family protein [Salinicola corii]KAA0020342.1 acyltransferase family protein [Salinicola corii]